MVGSGGEWLDKSGRNNRCSLANFVLRTSGIRVVSLHKRNSMLRARALLIIPLGGL